eukprot:gnl/TRDRNA2_/TRDRNA2_165850_c0_seq2.p1 gnl/TRDRNA2_/TRDRNA2_165850_c0~~gnl/TRDRNA2_/TRDRNA2_165850_c0_seq2.p1  ORF type:complete len:446 (+),score=111.63 gnl/TRDRNA2_/TRDRNA2_165850_c0_seq2:198-1340(+)
MAALGAKLAAGGAADVPKSGEPAAKAKASAPAAGAPRTSAPMARDDADMSGGAPAAKRAAVPAARPKGAANPAVPKGAATSKEPEISRDREADVDKVSKKTPWSAPPREGMRRRGRGPMRSMSGSSRASSKEQRLARPPPKPRPPPPPPVPKDEGPEPPMFECWLATLKFLTGWNDQRASDAETITRCYNALLTAEGIEHSIAVARLKESVVPLLLDLRRIDQAVVKHLPKQYLKGLRILQIQMVRVVTFELLRERDAKAAKLAKDRAAKKAGKTVDNPGGAKGQLGKDATYLVSDISSMAKIVQHFRFDRKFSEGLQNLIGSIRLKGKNKQADKEQGKNKRPAKGGEGTDAAAATGDNEAASRNSSVDGPAAKRARTTE